MNRLFGIFAALLLSSYAFADAPTKDPQIDKGIYDALNVVELALPTAFPLSGFQKQIGRLSCRHVTDSKTKAETYGCQLETNDWTCEALCPTGDGFKLIPQHNENQVDALNAVSDKCKADYGGHDSGRIFVEVNHVLVQASVKNACWPTITN